MRAPDADRTATAVQAGHQTDFKIAARAALADTCGAAGLARALGVSETLVRDWAALESPKHFPAWALVRARDVAADFVTSLEARLATASPSPTVSIESLHRHLTALNGACAGELDRALADGVLDERERRDLSRIFGQIARKALAAQSRVEEPTP